jgi:hypothetical protein
VTPPPLPPDRGVRVEESQFGRLGSVRAAMELELELPRQLTSFLARLYCRLHLKQHDRLLFACSCLTLPCRSGRCAR